VARFSVFSLSLLVVYSRTSSSRFILSLGVLEAVTRFNDNFGMSYSHVIIYVAAVSVSVIEGLHFSLDAQASATGSQYTSIFIPQIHEETCILAHDI
jgi:hypothetical protein